MISLKFYIYRHFFYCIEIFFIENDCLQFHKQIVTYLQHFVRYKFVEHTLQLYVRRYNYYSVTSRID